MIWIGGLVTTYGAGMAVPDWPNTYGYNLFLYPWQTWVYGPFKLFIEHGHRLFGTLVGMIAIAFLVSTWCCQRRANLRWLGAAALIGVVAQGALGGLRVLADEVQIAKIHGIVGPVFFAFTVALASITSRRWQSAKRSEERQLGAIERLGVITTLLVFLQLVLGAQLRHLSPEAPLGNFRLALFFHLAVAVALLAHVFMLAARVLYSHRQESWLARPAVGLLVMLLVQIGLGAGSWVTNYGFPVWLSRYDFAAAYVPVADGAVQAWTTTAHVALGSLILATSLMLTLRSMRLSSPLSARFAPSKPATSPSQRILSMGAGL